MLAELTSRLPEKDFFPDGTQLAGLRLLEKDFLPEMEITGKQFKKLHGKKATVVRFCTGTTFRIYHEFVVG